MSWSSRRFPVRAPAVAGLALAVTLALAGCGGAAPSAKSAPSAKPAASAAPKVVQPAAAARAPALQPVTIANTSLGVQLLLLQVALKKGFFAKHGLAPKVTLVNGDAASIPAVVSGSVDFSVATATPALVGDAKGGHLQMISPLSTFPGQLVMSKALAGKLGITSATPLKQRLLALKGHKVAVLDVGGGLQYQLDAVLASYGIDPKTVPVVGIHPFSSELIALKRGEVNVILPAIPFGQLAVDGGYGVMIANIWGGEVPAIHGEPFEVLLVNQKWAAAHVKTVEAVRAAMQDAMNYLHAHVKGAAAVEHQLQPKLKASLITAVMGNGAGYPASTSITSGQFAAMQEFAKLSGAKTASVTYAQAVWASPSSTGY